MDLGKSRGIYITTNVYQSESNVNSLSLSLSIALVFFRMVVFRPFIGEVLVGKIASSSPNGIRVTLQFFDDIVIPAEWMKENSLL